MRMSDRFYEEIKTSHRVISYVDVIAPDLETVRLMAIDGGVDVDRTASYRRKCGIECVDPEGKITPRRNGEILTPYGTEIRPYRGVRYADGTEEIAPLGVFRLSQADVSDSNIGAPVVSLEGFDRSRVISRDKFKVPYTVAANTNALTAIKNIVKMTFADVQYDAITTSVKTTAPMLFDAAADPWEAVTLLATAMGCDIYFNASGVLTILPPDELSALPQPEFSYVEGEGCTMLAISRKYSDVDPGYNGVIVTGESIGDDLPPVRGEAWDNNPASPTYRHGPYGEVPMFHTDQLAKTSEQAATVAQSILASLLGASSQIGMEAVVHPAFEAGDIVKVKRERSGVDGLFSIDAFNIPLSASETQSLILRERRAA